MRPYVCEATTLRCDDADEIRLNVDASAPALEAELVLKVMLCGHKARLAVCSGAGGLRAPAGLCRATF